MNCKGSSHNQNSVYWWLWCDLQSPCASVILRGTWRWRWRVHMVTPYIEIPCPRGIQQIHAFNTCSMSKSHLSLGLMYSSLSPRVGGSFPRAHWGRLSVLSAGCLNISQHTSMAADQQCLFPLGYGFIIYYFQMASTSKTGLSNSISSLSSHRP